ncbi:GDSL-type esterase/lipase family protein [Frondihabitans cladoniiphilus]|uniref:SGNH hydrolase-type esterase domain-containing protein n=1 Tax=Frondihabitans cladoniiphilus TaxID=715785 RepID=A0ABP8W221_9MICO
MTSLDPLVRLFGRPLLRLSFALFKREIRRAPMPRDEPDGSIPGPHPERLVFIGDVLTGGYGVVTHDISTHARTAQLVAARRGRGVDWVARIDPTRLADELAVSDVLDLREADVAVVLLGVTDVLFLTRTDAWATALAAITDRLRRSAGPDCEVVFVAIPPLADFWPIPLPFRQLIRWQADRLNAATRDLVTQLPGVRYSEFPGLVGPARSRGPVSWRHLHDQWARGLTPLVIEALEERSADGGVSATA